MSAVFVISTFGPDKGLLVEIDIEAATAMLADGRATKAFTEPEPPVEIAHPKPHGKPHPTRPAKR